MNGIQAGQLVPLVSDLPEVYQPIFGHQELSGEVSRPCEDRLATVFRIYDALQTQLGRPLRVLDLGCAQGYFSLSLAERGAQVFGLDCLDRNIAVCRALAGEHPEFNVQFETGRIENFSGLNGDRPYDLVLCLSVFHHIIHEKGLEAAQRIIDSLAGSAGLLLVEAALREEPLYWAESQPEDPQSLFQNCAFVQETARHPTHLSALSRPLYAASNRFWVVGDVCGMLESWTDDPHAFAKGTHQGSRRYFFGSNAVVKKYRFDHPRGLYNRQEFEREVAFLKNVPEGFPAPTYLTSASCETEGWVVLKRLPGRLLLELLQDQSDIDRMAVLRSVLTQLAALEAAGLYHNDVRVWNILVEEDGAITLLDAGAISSDQEDCVWPENIFLSFFIFVHELLTREIAPTDLLRMIHMTPYTLPQPYRDWAAALWRYPVDEWSFSLMLQLLNSDAVTAGELNQPLGVWVDAVEEAVSRQIEFVEHLRKQIAAADSSWNGLIPVIERMEDIAADIQVKTCRVVSDGESARTKAEERALRAEDRAVQSEARARHDLKIALIESRRAEQAEQNLRGELSTAREAEATVREELSTAQGKIDELNQSSHHWWTMADGLTGELRETRERSQWLENEWNAAKAKIDELNQSSNHWWTVADTFRQQLEEVHGSRCVRWTAPLRQVSLQIRRLRAEGLFARLKLLVKKILRPVARNIGRFILRHPRFKERVRIYLTRHPRQDARVRRFAEVNDLICGSVFPRFQIVAAQKLGCDASRGEFSGQLVSVSGLFGPEPWGSWSDGKEIELSFEEPLPERFELYITAKAFGPNTGQECVVRIGSMQGGFIAEAEPISKKVELTNPNRSNRLIIEVPEPVSPAEISDSTDHRQLGLGLCDLTVIEGAHVCKIDFQCLETGLMSPRTREMYKRLKRARAGQKECGCVL